MLNKSIQTKICYSATLSTDKKDNEGIDTIFCVANKPTFPFGQ